MSVKQEPAAAVRRTAPTGPHGPVGILLAREEEEANKEILK